MPRLLSLLFLCSIMGFAHLSAASWVDEDGIVCVEVERVPANGKWTELTTEEGYSGSSYYWFDDNHNTGVISWSDDQAMTYTINITQAGVYQFLAKGLIGYDTQLGEHNDAWVKMSGVPADGEYSIATDSAIKFYLSNLGWTYHSATKDEDQQPIRQYFSAGSHTIQIAGRSSDYCIDRFLLIHESKWDNLLKSGSKWNSNPSWGKNTSTLDAIEETFDPEANIGPSVNAGDDITVEWSTTTVSLDATVSDDGKPNNSLTYSWSQISGPEDATIASATSEDTTVTLPTNGTYVFELSVSDGEFTGLDKVAVTRYSEGGGPLAGQIIVDPKRGNYLVRNQDLDNDGELDPYMMAGVGGPEQFLYLGTRQADGTRSGGKQQEIIDELIEHGVNGIYLQSIRSFGGDAGKDDSQSPFNVSDDPDSGLDPEIMAQWHGWFTQMKDADIGILFFIYDDHAKPWGSSGDSVPAGEEAFLTAITNEFEDYPNIIFVMAEEYQYAGFSIERVSNMAAIVSAADDHDHAIGVHHNIGLGNQFVGDPSIDVFVQQADLREGDQMAALHDDYGVQQGFSQDGHYAYIMGEGFGYHQDLIGLSDKRDELRQSLYATAMAGGALTVFGAYEGNWGRDPIPENLQDMGRLVDFFHSTPFNTMDPNDGLAYGDTDWVKASAENDAFIAYSKTAPSTMGIRDLPPASYHLRWYDAKDGEWVTETVTAAGSTAWEVPAEMDNDTVLEIIYQGPADNLPPEVDAGSDITLAHDKGTVSLDATVSDDGKPDGSSLTYTWTQESGPTTASFGSPNSEDTSVTLPTAGTYVLRLSVSDGEFSTVDEVTVTRSPDLSNIVYAINCGGDAYTAADGTPYEADNYAENGESYSKSKTISGTEDGTLFTSERYAEAPDTVDYAFPVSNGDYVVTLMWSENTGSGRIMDISAEGELRIDNLDVVAESGNTQTAYEQSVTVTVSDETLNINIACDSTATEKYPNIMAIRISSNNNDPQPVERVISIDNLEGFIWTIDPETGSMDDSGSSTTFDGLDATDDHLLTPAPSAGG